MPNPFTQRLLEQYGVNPAVPGAEEALSGAGYVVPEAPMAEGYSGGYVEGGDQGTGEGGPMQEAPVQVAANIPPREERIVPGGAFGPGVGQDEPLSREQHGFLTREQQPIPGTSGFASYEQTHPQGGFQAFETLPNGMRVYGLTPEQEHAQEEARANAEIDAMTGGLPLSQGERMQMQQYLRGMGEVRRRLGNGSLSAEHARDAIKMLHDAFNPLKQREEMDQARTRSLQSRELTRQAAEAESMRGMSAEQRSSHFMQHHGVVVNGQAIGWLDEKGALHPFPAVVSRQENMAKIEERLSTEMDRETNQHNSAVIRYHEALRDWNKLTADEKKDKQPPVLSHEVPPWWGNETARAATLRYRALERAALNHHATPAEIAEARVRMTNANINAELQRHSMHRRQAGTLPPEMQDRLDRFHGEHNEAVDNFHTVTGTPRPAPAPAETLAAVRQSVQGLPAPRRAEADRLISQAQEIVNRHGTDRLDRLPAAARREIEDLARRVRSMIAPPAPPPVVPRAPAEQSAFDMPM